jgi:hypothetical protein
MSVSGNRVYKVWPMGRAAQGIKIVKMQFDIGILRLAIDAV